MTNSQVPLERVRDGLRSIVGLRLYKSRNFYATRHFCFGGPETSSGEGRSRYTIGVECPWRIEKAGQIIVGSDDYYERADNNEDPGWEAGMPGGHLQDQKLAELLGEIRDGDIMTLRQGFLVRAAEISPYGDILIDFDEQCALRIVPVSTRGMQWILMPSSEPSVVLVDGLLQGSARREIRDAGSEPVSGGG